VEAQLDFRELRLCLYTKEEDCMPPFSKAKSDIGLDDLRNLVIQWLNAPDNREERRFLEAHPELLDPKTAIILENMIASVRVRAMEIWQRTGVFSSEGQEAMRFLRGHLNLLRDIEMHGGTTAAIREGYVNVCGGFVLDLPPWLEKVEHQLHELLRTGQSDQTVAECVTLLRTAIARAQDEAGFAPEVLAEVNYQLWDALHEAVEVSERQRQEEEIGSLLAALRVYTYARYPYMYARTQTNLAHAYYERIEGEREANLKQAIACCREALRVYTYEAFPMEYARTQTNLGKAYQERIEGERGVNLEQAIACCREALRVYTYEVFPVEYAGTQTNLGNAYVERIEGERGVNLEQAIACFRAALQGSTLEVFPVEYAMAQYNLGLTYGTRIAGERRANLEEAIACFHAALQVFTLEAFPVESAKIQHDLGVAYQARIAHEMRNEVVVGSEPA
jgi:tetratricopeptide (TPR) repeat protein